VDPYNPLSSKQTLAYLKLKGYKIRKNRVTKKDSADEESLEQIATDLVKAMLPEDPVLKKIIECRKYNKGIGYLYDSFLGRDGRMHPQFTFIPDTGRLSSKNPNFQNVPAGKSNVQIEKEIADAIRSTVIPTKGRVLIELDWKAIEALLTGFFADDPDYVRVSLMDPHSYLASFLVGKPADLSWDDDRLGRYLKQIKKDHFFEREYLAKKANHSGNYGIGIKHLAEVLQSDFKTAKWVLEMMARAFPKVHKWKETTRMQAHLEQQLMNPFGYTRAFFEVFKKNPKGEWIHGSEANEALAFLPQSTAAAMMRECLVILDALQGHTKYWWLLITIHDSIVIECIEGLEKKVISEIKKIMERPWPELGNLTVQVDAKMGMNWSQMKELK
jgi:DNA polymerase I-like protein with 3'-5' exonuclease and polymerase domains